MNGEWKNLPEDEKSRIINNTEIIRREILETLVDVKVEAGIIKTKVGHIEEENEKQFLRLESLERDRDGMKGVIKAAGWLLGISGGGGLIAGIIAWLRCKLGGEI